ncbi:HsdM N-terminal domain-containing protein [Candidatus Electrothrix aarhusensis]|uniref:HsdM N-terminal domain-containing protein n=1 Tax=Candidatus Electrothrix aarhusensis TaxID=1859131 RepID=A0A3S3R4D7_9BACT|nr:HsdM N-terminal domain-containing protein [Candidatus Electrothrix aarhusensis]
MNNEKLTLSQLEQYLAKAAWILKGPVDASDFKVYIFPLLFFKRISDVYDEEFRIAGGIRRGSGVRCSAGNAPLCHSG